MIYANVEQGSEAWHEIRAGKFTGTDFKSLFMGENTKGFRECISGVVASSLTATADDGPDLSSIEAVARGSALEDFARRELCEITGLDFQECGFVDHSDEVYAEWVGVSPDGIVFDEFPNIITGCEIKCPGAKAHLNYILAGKVPKEYYHQVQGAMFVTGADHWYFMSYHPDLKPFILKVDRDADFMETMEGKVKAAIILAKEIMTAYTEYDYQV